MTPRAAHAQKMLQQQQAAQESAAKRIAVMQKEREAKFEESRTSFDVRRKACLEKHKEDAVKLEKQTKEYKKKAEEELRRTAEVEAQRIKEWHERASDTDEQLLNTSRSLKSALSSRSRSQQLAWEEKDYMIQARVEANNSARRRLAQQHNEEHHHRTEKYAEKKGVQDSEKEARFAIASRETTQRLYQIEQEKKADVLKEHKLQRAEFQLKSALVEQEWTAKVLKYDPGRVRHQLSQSKAPIPTETGMAAPSGDSPRTAERVARARALCMMLTAREEQRARQHDKEWEKRCTAYEQERQRRELEHSKRIAARQKEVASAVETRERELLHDAESEKMMNRIKATEMGRQRELDYSTSMREIGKLELKRYQTHTVEAEKRRWLMS